MNVSIFFTAAHFNPPFFSDFIHDLPTLSADHIAMLNDNISEAEIRTAIESASQFSAPGPDGLTYVFYKCFLDVIISDLVSIFNGIFAESYTC